MTIAFSISDSIGSSVGMGKAEARLLRFKE